MYCANCGTNNPDTASICANCGRSLAAAASTPPVAGGGGAYTPPPTTPGSYAPPPVGGGYAPGGAPPGSVPNYLVQAILVTLCCCLPGGIVAIIYAVQVNSKLAAGDVAGAMESSRNAKLWCWISFGVGLAATVVWLLVGGAGFVQGLREGMAGQ